MNSESSDRMKSDSAAGEIRGFLDLNMVGGRYSSLLVGQLEITSCTAACNLP